MMPDPGVPPDLLGPKQPVLVRRRRPPTVTLARNLMVVGCVVGVLSALTIFTSVASVARAFEHTAATTDATPDQIAAITSVVRTVLVSDGIVALVLAGVMGGLAIGVGRGSGVARTAALAVVVASLCFGLGSASYTTLGRQANWTRTVDGASEQLTSQIGQAYADAMPGVLVGATGGLTDLQSLGYIAVAVLLLAPASRPHFRRRTAVAAPAPADPP